MDLQGRSLLEIADLNRDEFRGLVALAKRLRNDKRSGTEQKRMIGQNLALVFEKPSTRTRSAFDVGAHDQGAQTTYMGPDESHLGESESVKDTARVLGRMFDGIEFRGFAHSDVVTLDRFAGVPVWNGLTDQWHPTQMLADVLTIIDHCDKPLEQVVLCYLGDGTNNTANSLLVTGALLGFDVRIAAPVSLWPSLPVRSLAEGLAAKSGARLSVTDSTAAGVSGADFVYTDVWLSMGEPDDEWGKRIDLLLPYQVNRSLMESTGNPSVQFMHCLPALHDLATALGRRIHGQRGLDALEVTDEVFESSSSVVFDQAENRLHTAKAVMVATLGVRD